MEALNNISLKYRIAIIIFLLQTVMVSLVLWRSQIVSYNEITSELKEHEDIYLSLISDLGQSALVTSEYGELQHYADKLKKIVSINNIIITDYRNVIVVSSEHALIGSTLPLLKDNNDSHWKSQQISLQSGDIGGVHINFSSKRIQTAYRKSVTHGVAIAGFSMVVIAIAGLLIGYFLVKRLEILNDSAKEMSLGDLDVQTNISGTDEIAQLANTFNILAVKIKLSMDALKKSEIKYRNLFESSTDGIFILDLNGNFIDVNTTAYTRLGYTKNEILDLHISKIDSPEFACLVTERMAQILEHGVAIFESAHMRKDGTVMPVEINSRLIDYEGKTVYLSIIRDITERRNIEESIQQTKERLSRAQTISHVGDWEWDITTNTVHWSDELYRIYGFEPYSIAPDYNLVLAHMHPTSKDEFLTAIENSLKEDQHFEMNYRFFRKNGTEAVLHTIGQVIRDASGVPVRMLGIVQDITDRNQVEEDLRETNELFSLFMRHSPIYVYIKKVSPTESRVLQASTNFHQMIGLSSSDLTGKTMAELFPPEFAAKITADDWAVVSGGEVLKFDEEFNGHMYTTIKFPLVQKNRTLLAGYTIDITDRILAEEQVLRSLKEKTVMLKEIHHRVKNNMQVIYSLLNLQAKCIADQTVRSMFEESRDRVSSMALIHEKLYRSEDLAYIDFNVYLHSLVHGIANTYKRHDVDFDLHREPLALNVNVGIPCGLIVNELVSNCLKYAFPNGRKGTITVKIERDCKGNNVLTVADNGIGLPETVDFQNTASLGLQLVNVLTGQIHGKIELSKEAGSKFKITFPG